MNRTLTIIMCGLLLALPVQAAPKAVKNFTPGARGTVLLFVASGCPCMDAHRLMVKSLLSKSQNTGINFYCIFSNEGESRVLIDHFFNQIGWDMPYIVDASGKLADRYNATHTPEAIVLDPALQMVFRGPIDDSSRNLGRVTQAYLQDALHDIQTGQPVRVADVQPTGCWIVTKNGIRLMGL